MSDALERAVEIARELEHRKLTNRLKHYEPYEYQKKFHNTVASQRLLMAGNRIGKSFCGAMEMAFHLTGKYPKWWEGRKFTKPTILQLLGDSNRNLYHIILASKLVFLFGHILYHLLL